MERLRGDGRTFSTDASLFGEGCAKSIQRAKIRRSTTLFVLIRRRVASFEAVKRSELVLQLETPERRLELEKRSRAPRVQFP